MNACLCILCIPLTLSTPLHSITTPSPLHFLFTFQHCIICRVCCFCVFNPSSTKNPVCRHFVLLLWQNVNPLHLLVLHMFAVCVTFVIPPRIPPPRSPVPGSGPRQFIFCLHMLITSLRLYQSTNHFSVSFVFTSRVANFLVLRVLVSLCHTKNRWVLSSLSVCRSLFSHSHAVSLFLVFSLITQPLDSICNLFFFSVCVCLFLCRLIVRCANLSVSYVFRTFQRFVCAGSAACLCRVPCAVCSVVPGCTLLLRGGRFEPVCVEPDRAVLTGQNEGGEERVSNRETATEQQAQQSLCQQLRCSFARLCWMPAPLLLIKRGWSDGRAVRQNRRV